MMRKTAFMLLFLIVGSLFVSLYFTPFQSNTQINAFSLPTPAANVASNNTYPATNAQLYTNNNHNFTTGVRDDTFFNRNWDSANLIVQQSDQVAYSNTSLTNLGTYNATYSFTDDRAGGLAEGWTSITSAATSEQVITPYLGHQNVLQIYDNGAGGADYVYAINNFAAQAAGTVSFWFCFTPITCQYIRVYLQGGGLNGVDLLFGNSLVQAYNGGWVTIKTPTANRWYHFNVTFVAGATRTYNVDIDGVRVATGYAFQQATATIDTFLLYTDGAGTTNYYGWLDAVDYSWTPGFDASKSRNAIDLGQLGIYNTTQSFEDNTMFTNVPTSPLGTWADASGASCYARVFPAVATQPSYHHNVICLDDQNAGTSASVTYTLTNAITQGWVEAWILSTDTSKTTQGQFILYATGYAAYICNIYIVVNVLYAYGTGAVSLGAVASNTWYHIRINFNTDTDLFSVWVNGMLRSSNQAGGASADVKRVYYDTGALANTAFQVYLDAFDLSTDPQYYTERSTYLRLNSTTTFPVPNQMLSFPVAGAYAYKWQAWSSNVAYDQGPVPFVVLPNVQLNSESNAMTRWTFTDLSMGSWASLYDADFSTYSLVGVSNPNIQTNSSISVTDDSYVVTGGGHDGTNYDGEATLQVQKPVAGIEARAVIGTDYNAYLLYNMNATLNLYWTWDLGNPANVRLYRTSTFDEGTVTWNNRPTPSLMRSLGTIPTGWNAISNIPAFWAEFDTQNIDIWAYGYVSSIEDAFPSYFNNVTIAKFNVTTDLLMIQTNTTETLTIQSPAFTDIPLLPNDRVTVTFNTTSTKQINLNLKKDGIEVGDPLTPLVSNPNYVFTTQTKTFTITDALTIDQLEFTGTFDDTKNLQISSITIERGSFPSYTFDVGAYTKDLVSITPKNYTLTVLDMGSGEIGLDEAVVVSGYTLNKFSYSPITGGQRIVNFFNPSGDILDFYQFRCNLTRTYNNLTVNYNLTTPYFFGDDGSTFQLNVTDRFGNSIVNYTDFVSTFIDITLTNIFSLKIKNEMRLPTLLQLTRNSITQSEYAISGEIIEYTLWNGTYQLNYTQSETGGNLSINLNVTSASYYVLNTSYFNVYISAYSADFPQIPLDSFRLFIDGVQYFWGFNDLLEDSYAFVVKDWFDANVYSAMRSISDATPINLPIAVFSFKIENLMRNETYYRLASPGGILERWLLPGTQDELVIGGGNYQLLYTQTETNTPVTFNFVIAGPTRYVINSSYHVVYFSAFANDLLGLPQDTVRLYINGTRNAWGPIELLGNSHNVLVLDYFGIIQYNATVDLSNCTEFNVFVNMATLLINNDNNQTLRIRIAKGGTTLLEQAVGSRNSLLFRFTNGTYKVSAYYLNGTQVGTTKTISLATNSTQLVSFGYYSAYAPPVDFYGLGWVDIFMVMLVAVLLTVSVFLVKRKPANKFSATKLPATRKIKKAVTARTKLLQDDRHNLDIPDLWEKKEPGVI